MPRAMARAVACGTSPLSASITMDDLLMLSRNSTDRPPPRKISLMSFAPGAGSVCVLIAACLTIRDGTRRIGNMRAVLPYDVHEPSESDQRDQHERPSRETRECSGIQRRQRKSHELLAAFRQPVPGRMDHESRHDDRAHALRNDPEERI